MGIHGGEGNFSRQARRVRSFRGRCIRHTGALTASAVVEVSLRKSSPLSDQVDCPSPR